MLRHTDIWGAIDGLAKAHGLSPSALARRAGLDPTTFNKSKRVTREGRLRWPSTESIAKIIDATSIGLVEFFSLVPGRSHVSIGRNFPVIGFAQAGMSGFFDDGGYPTGGGWDEIPFPEVGDPHAYALEIAGGSMEPVYRDGDLIIVSPQASIRKGDRVVVKTRAGEVTAKMLGRRTINRVELQPFNAVHPEWHLDSNEVLWIARIVWASQ